MEEIYDRKRYLDQIKILAASKEVLSSSDNNTFTRFLQKNKSSTGVIPTRKQRGKKTP